ncbi:MULTISPECIES: hypothetical protein [Novosphingobium]|uniref:hypothetical protein n=1 Tax=Novosphingobium TaxID=165696 RepID=UPI001CD34238|nr:hypothetical protein [Novosphingobium percolationis]MCH7629675.1 hypothetical protein [Pseudomonadota bacterium]
MKVVFKIIGMAAIFMGLLWMAQGTGLLMWPASSFMLAQRQWALWGLLLAALGLVLLLRAGRRR